MIEFTFKIRRDSEFYVSYFKAKEEKEKLNTLTKEFLLKHGLDDVTEYYPSERLSLKLSEVRRLDFENQLLKKTDHNGMSYFRLTSPMQKAWEEETVSKIDFETLNKVRFWWMHAIVANGSYALWDYKGDIYGCVTENYADHVNRTYDMIPVDASEYYAILEQGS